MKTLNKRSRWIAAGVSLGLLVLVPTSAWAAPPGDTTGPSSSAAAYIVGSFPGVTVTSLLTTGDSVDGYQMAGSPDGLGAYDNGDGTFTLLVNRELPASEGTVHDHGAVGAYISKWTIDSTTLEVLAGEDLVKAVYLWSGTEYVATPGAAFNRLCSADLAAPSAYYNAATGLGYQGRIFTNGEEASGGRAFAHVVDTGESYQLPDFGGAAWENIVANPATGDRTVVVGTDDATGGAVYVYVGAKSASGNPIERAGLVGGDRYAVSVAGLTAENADVSLDGAEFSFTLTQSAAATTAWARPEDGAWDPSNPSDFYFVTTASMTQHSRLWKLHFDDPANPSLGGTATVVIEGPTGATGGPKMMDNLTINDRGQVLVQEDPGDDAYLAGIWRYRIATHKMELVAQHDPARFLPDGAVFETIDEESSGIITAPFLGEGAHLLDVQMRLGVDDPTKAQHGQLLVLRVPPGKRVELSRRSSS